MNNEQRNYRVLLSQKQFLKLMLANLGQSVWRFPGCDRLYLDHV